MNTPAPARRRRRRGARLRNIGRLVGPMDVLYQVGNFIYRRSLRYTLFTASLGLLGVFASFVKLPGISVKQAIMFPLLVGGSSLLGGFLLRLLPSLISVRLQVRAQGADLNLMEDHRKAQGDTHIAAFWARIYRHECAVRLADGQALFGGQYTPPEGADALVAAQAEFEVRAADALQSAEPQLRQMYRVGLDLRFLEDWRDGGWFDPSDIKLREQFDGSATLDGARQLVGMRGALVSLRLQPRRVGQRFWHWFVTRALAMNVAAAVDRLNASLGTDIINAQVILWPGEEDEPWIAQTPGASDEVLAHRDVTIRGVFGPTLHTARELVDHMFYASYAEATELRMRYDPEYCEGSLGAGLLDDLRADHGQAWHLRQAERFVERARPRLAAFDAHVAEHAEGRRSALVLRAARGLSHAGVAPGIALERAAAEVDTWTRRLVAVRIHHELARLTINGYEALLDELAYDEAEGVAES